MAGPKIWFVTGASRGFGRLWTEGALARGDKVVATARDATALDALAQAYGPAVLPLPLDVTDRDAVFEAVRRGHDHFGRLDVVLTAAGYGLLGATEEVSPTDARDNIETNVFGTLSVIQAALPFLRMQGSGHILPVSSLGGVVALPMFFQATKFCIEAIGEALSQEIAAFGIAVTIIEPGAFDTSFFSAQSLKASSPLEAYDRMRAGLASMMTPDQFGDPKATFGAIAAAVDAAEPPLRLVLGSTALPLIRQAYTDRMAVWSQWEGVSNAAQGNRLEIG